MRAHPLTRIIVAAAMLVGAAGGVVAVASPAEALQSCGSYGPEEMSYTVYPAPNPSISVDDIFPCFTNENLDIQVGVTISRYVGGSGWQVVDSGKGFINFPCTGGRFLYTTSVTTAEGKPAFYCG